MNKCGAHECASADARLLQVMLPEGPSTYSVGDMEAAGKLAEKVVANYGMTDLGILAYAPPPGRKEFGKQSFEARGRPPLLCQTAPCTASRGLGVYCAMAA